MNMKTTTSGSGLTGLTNLGNTCFINSCIQVLSHTNELNQMLDHPELLAKYNQHEYPYDCILIHEWNQLRQLMWSQNCIISPTRFIKHVHLVSSHKNKEEFANYSQNDTSEFFLFIIDCFHSALSRKVSFQISGIPHNETDQLAITCYKKIQELFHTNYSEIYELFYGIHVSQIIAIEDDRILSNTPEPFSIINLPIPPIKEPTLIDCLNLYLKGEILDGDNAWYNETTRQKQSVQKKIVYWSLPSILVIDIKRINPYNYNNKNQAFISFPINNLDLSEYVIGYSKESYIYDLYAICNHHGGTQGGHYYSFIRVQNNWFCFNDTSVTEITNLSQLITPNAYLFFYRKRQK